ncbi:MAG: hypothetical protein H7A43_04985 [Verrucomicrobia bacterium]|nr:hypothetical protein [Kiritimatiellia bacterium]MCP5487983.1 hypothetical protein [Verrucomicrobiota bacterium]
MKTKWSILFGSLLAVGLIAPKPAQAINKEWSAAAGFVGGMLFNQAIQCDRTVVTHQQSVVEYRPQRRVYIEEPEPCGYWEVRREKVWVPGCWEYIDLGCNRYRKEWSEGYYRWDTRRVWVDEGPRHSRRYVRR